MKITQLDATFVRYTGNGGHQDVATFADAQGVLFLFNEVEDDGLEDLLVEIQGASWEHTQDSIGGAGANVIAHERATEAEHDTDPSPPPESAA